MKENMKCPICGNIHERLYYKMEAWGGWIICEDYYNCPDCGYWYNMAYSDYCDGIEPLYTMKQIKLLIKNYKKIHGLMIKFKKQMT